MKSDLDQISIPPLCKGLSEMAHTLLGKVVPLQLKGHGWKHIDRNLQDPRQHQGHNETKFFFCGLILSPLLGTVRMQG